jgi:hypothetical protein
MPPEKLLHHERRSHDETIARGFFLTRLAAHSTAPGGGATGALHAALLAMVARFSDGPRHDAEVVSRVRAAADGLRARLLTPPRRSVGTPIVETDYLLVSETPVGLTSR